MSRRTTTCPVSNVFVVGIDGRKTEFWRTVASDGADYSAGANRLVSERLCGQEANQFHDSIGATVIGSKMNFGEWKMGMP